MFSSRKKVFHFEYSYENVIHHGIEILCDQNVPIVISLNMKSKTIDFKTSALTVYTKMFNCQRYQKSCLELHKEISFIVDAKHCGLLSMGQKLNRWDTVHRITLSMVI